MAKPKPPLPDQIARRHPLLRPLWMRGFRRRHRWLVRGLLSVPFGLALLLIILTRTAVTRVVVMNRLGSVLNVEASADAAFIRFDGQLVIDRARFRAPGIPGPAGQLLSVGRVVADVDWWSFLRGGNRVRGVRLVEPVVTVSQSLDDGSLNIASLVLPDSSAPSGPIPAVMLERAGIEIGEHSGASYSLLRHVVMDGSFRPAPTGEGVYEFRLRETSMRPRRPGGPAESGFIVSGEMDNDRIEVEVSNFTLDDWPAVSVPTPVRKLFEELDLRGEVPTASMRYTSEGGITAGLILNGVSMNLPIEPDPTLSAQLFGPPTRLMRMHGVSGQITFAQDSVNAAVEGLVEDLPYAVKLHYDGVSIDSPFTLDFETKGFRVQRNPGLLPYAPPEVRKWMGMFSSPVATVDTRLTVRRGPPAAGEPGEITVQGELDLKDGVASYAKFPYAFHDLAGRFRFDTDSIEIVGLTGRSPSGADLVATGLISPLDDTAEVTINVDVRSAPIDDAMAAAFGPGRDQLIPSLFNQRRYQDLLDARLIQPSAEARTASGELEERKRALASAAPADAPAISARIAALEEQLRIPPFDFGGKADIRVRVHAPRGKDVEYQTDIDISIPSAGLVPEKFPLPIEARDVAVRVENERGRLVAGSYRAVGGGTADVAASFTVPGDKGSAVRPEITVTAAGMPLSELVVHALPGPAAQAEPGASGSAVKRILRDMNIAGAGGGTVRIAAREGEPGAPLGFDADLYFTGVQASPRTWPDAWPLEFTGIAGRLVASEARLHADLTGIAEAPGSLGPVATGPVRATIDAQFPPGGAPASYRAEVVAPGLNIAAPVETAVGVFSPAAADRLVSLRAEYRPDGPVDIHTLVESAEPGGQPRTRVELAGAGEITLRALGQQIGLTQPSGRVVVASGTGVTLGATGVVAPMTFAGEPAGTLMLDGQYALTPGTPQTGSPLRVGLRDGRFDSDLVRNLLATNLSERFQERYAAYQPRGIFDAYADIRPTPGGKPSVRGRVEPRELEVDAGGVPVHLEEMGGAIEFEPGAGQFRQLSGQARDWSFRVDGAWETDDAGGLWLRSEWSGSGTSLSPDLRAALPEELRSVLDQIALKVHGPFTLEDAALTLDRGAGTEDNATSFTGSIGFSDAALDAGVELRNINGRVHVDFDSRGGRPPVYKVDLRGDNLRVSGIPVTRAHAMVTSGQGPGEVLVPEASGESFSGRIAATARVVPVSPAPGAPRRFEATTRLAGVRFSPFLDELAAKLKVTRPGAPVPTEPDDSTSRSRGALDAELSMQGVVGRPDSRRGRGSFRVAGGRILSFPFMTRMIEVSNLAMPGNAKLDYATGSFFVEGGLITFDDLAIISEAVQILGYGTMTWPGKVLDLRFDSRASKPIPILSAVLQGIRDELVTTTIRGKLGEHDVRLQQFPGTRRILGRAADHSQSDRSRRMAELQRRSRSGAQSIQPAQPKPPR